MTDWSKLLLELRSKGLKSPAIARHAGVDATTIRDLIGGRIKEPKYSVGEAIKDLHGRLCGSRATS